MSENLSLDATIAKLKAEAQETLKQVISENKQRFEASLVSRQQPLLEKLNPNLIKFNVGGYKFVTTLDTLSNIKDTKLHKMATGRYPITLDKKNRIFIDRNGQYFGHVLDCLRKGKVELPTTDSFLSSRVQREYEFFELVQVENKSNITNSISQKEETKTNNLQTTAGPPVFGVVKPAGSLFGSATPAPVHLLNQSAQLLNPKPPAFGAPPMMSGKPAVFGAFPGGGFGAKPAAFGTLPGGIFGAKPTTFQIQHGMSGGAQGLPTLYKPISFVQENYTWRFSSQVEGEFGVGSGPDRIKIEATEAEGQTIGDTLLTSGTHQWKFLAEEIVPTLLPSQVEDEIYCEGIVTFGVVTKQMWKKLKKNGDFYLICGFNTIGETFKADIGSKKKTGIKVDGPDQIKEIGCKNQEITVTFDTQSGVLKVTWKAQDGQEKSHMLRIKNEAGGDGDGYYPYFQISDARVQLIETKELSESEIKGMDFILEKNEFIGEDDDDSDYEDVESD